MSKADVPCTSSTSSPYYAAIDLGSNSFHMVVARISDNKVEIVDREKHMVQLARGLKPGGTLDKQAQARALTCLHRFAERLRNIPDSQTRAVGTKTLRSARGSSKFLSSAERVLGLKIEVISGYEEARLVYAGLANRITRNDQRLVIDIGGGSTEFIIGIGAKPLLLESLTLGCVSLTEEFIAQGSQINQHNMRAIYFSACAELEEMRRNYIKTGWQVAYGTSGTMKAVAELLVERDGGAVITKASLKTLIAKIMSEGKISAPSLPKLRREVLPAGLAIIEAIFDQLQFEKLHISDASLKEGLIYDTLGRLYDQDRRVETVAQLKKQYDIDGDHAERVSAMAKQFWSHMSSMAHIKGLRLPAVSRSKILIWAAELHEIGLKVSHSGYHHHGHYLLKHSDLAGFGRYEQYVLANLVRLHRKKLTREKVEDGLDETALQAFVPLLICLRLAVLLNRRRETPDELPQLSYKDNVYTLTFTKGWPESHPLTTSSLELEQSYYKNIGVELQLNVSSVH